MSEINLPILPLRWYQKPIWNHMIREIRGLRGMTIWPRRNGKDLTAINLLAAKAMQRVGDYAYVAPFANQMRGIIWEGTDGTGAKFIDYIPAALVIRKLDQVMKIFLKNGSTIQLFGSDNPDSLVGRNFVGIIFTEYSLHKDAVWGYLRPMLTENGGWALFNGTVRGMNHFYTMAKMAEKNPDWFYELLTCEDTDFPTQEEIQQERQAGMAESLIQQEFYNDWNASTEETLIPLEHIQTAVNTTLIPSDYEFAPRIIGVDPAYAEKGDEAVIVRRQGRMVHPLDVYQGIDPMALAAKVAFYLRDWHANYCFVDAGRGEAVWSRLFQLGFEDRVIPVDFGGAVYDPLYHRKKDEMWGRTKTWLCQPTLTPMLPDDEKLIRDLGAPTFEINDRGQMVLESKKALKKRGFTSTDRADALVLTHAEELVETPVLTDEMRELGVTDGILASLAHAQGMGNNANEEPYDPLTYMERYASRKGNFINQ